MSAADTPALSRGAPPSRGTRLPTLVLLGSATMWGLLWWPLKGFATAGLSGPMLSLLTYGAVGVCGIGFLWRQRPAWRSQAGLLLLMTLVGGWANTAFVQALMIGDVVRVMLLFYLAPVWSVLGGRVFLGESIGPRRALAVALALAGLWFVIGGSAAWAEPLGKADWLALSAGLAFAGHNVISRAAQAIPMLSKTVAVFVGCGLLSALLVTLNGSAWPVVNASIALALAGYAFGWLLLATATWQYGVTHLESGRAGLILTVELLVAVVSAVLLGDSTLLPREWAGGVLIALAALIEASDSNASQPEETRA
ncbi:MAG: DMT family transporter [Rhizobacter sp.]|jgi:drug/metabolite transporter (DMT)-like permease